MSQHIADSSNLNNIFAKYKIKQFMDVLQEPNDGRVECSLTYNINYKKSDLMIDEDYQEFENYLMRMYNVDFMCQRTEYGKQGRMHKHYLIRIHKDWVRPDFLTRTFRSLRHSKYGMSYTFSSKIIFDKSGWQAYIDKDLIKASA